MKTFTNGDRVVVTDSSSGKKDVGTITKVWPNYSGKPEEKDCFNIRLDKPWSGNDVMEVFEIGRTSATLEKL